MDDETLVNNGDPAPQDAVEGNDEPTQDPAPSQEKKTFTRRERLEFAKEKIEKQLREITQESVDDSRPLTVGDLKRMRQEEVRETALTLAQSIEDADEREQVIEFLSSRIQPSSDPHADLAVARGAVNSLKNQRVIEEMARKQTPNSYASAPSSPGKTVEQFVPTAEELVFMGAPYNLTQTQILEARKNVQK